MVVRHIEMTAHAGGLTRLSCVVSGDRTVIADMVRQAQDAAEPWELELKKPTHGRSKDANAYAWVLIDKLAERLGLTKSEVYRDVIREIGGVSESVYVSREAAPEMIRIWKSRGLGWQVEIMPSQMDGYINLVLYYGSSVYTSAQMARLIDQLVTECKAQGIETMAPDEIARLRGYGDGDKL